MLGKLLKYEIKATGRIFLPLFLALLVFAGITRIISSVGPEKWDAPAVISMIVYGLIMAGMFVMTLIMMVQRFYKNLLSDEGYLMLTLPVKTWQHIVSKLLTSMLWIVASGIAAIISIMIIALKQGDLTNILSGLVTFYSQVMNQLGAQAFILLLEMIILAFVSLASGILIIYASIALGHLFRKHKVLATFGSFIALSTLAQIFFTTVSLSPIGSYFIHQHFSASSLFGVQTGFQLASILGIVFNGLLCAAYFAITNTILSKRLNLE
ncbi:hypothetical protein Desor_4508 [Desulfosporosinus orientis DSM 765]|uniref:ABC-2 family transporter protein n=1 Tax=Desulfosporosinus orientis (strain ATCC 19365 / DSM 765 / NCIMB 8382 / VKM B-1628 / Singapore I) TaxID=768706 RepID=G7W9K0_DESOD|nr:hypothetical protein [Desulfosporosinus orientis]AET69917.1 hypothetical protein Desor_4508 [Desulfosporosinus orientis DSM 765]